MSYYNSNGDPDPDGTYYKGKPLAGPFNSFFGAMIALILIFGSATIVFFLTI